MYFRINYLCILWIVILQTILQKTHTIKSGTSDIELIGMMQGDAQQRNSALNVIYQANKERVCSYILANSGSRDEAKDVYQESMIAFYENVRDNRFRGESAISTYLYSIAKYKWLNQIKKNQVRNTHEDNLEIDTFSDSPLAKLIDDENKKKVNELLAQLGEACNHILIESIYHGTSMKEIAQQGNYSSEQIVRNKKYKCLQKLKSLLLTRPRLIHILKSNE